MYQQNHVGMHRSDDCGQTWTEITEGLPTEFGFAAATHPHDKETFYVVPLDPGHGRTMPDGQAAVWRTQDAGESWQRARHGFAAAGRVRRRAARGHGDRLATSRRGCTSGRAPARSSRAPTRARAGARSRATCRRSPPSRSRSSTSVAEVYLPRRCRRSFGAPAASGARRGDLGEDRRPA